MKSFNEWMTQKGKGFDGDFHYNLDEEEIGGKLYSGEMVVDLPFRGSPNDMDFGFKLVGFNNLVVFDDDGDTHPVEDVMMQQQIFNHLKNDDHFNEKAHEVFVDLWSDRISPDPEFHL